MIRTLKDVLSENSSQSFAMEIFPRAESPIRPPQERQRFGRRHPKTKRLLQQIADFEILDAAGAITEKGKLDLSVFQH